MEYFFGESRLRGDFVFSCYFPSCHEASLLAKVVEYKVEDNNSDTTLFFFFF